MLKLKKVAVTGGLSCGKSTVCRFFKELGAEVVSADEIVHQLLTPGSNLGQQVISLIGSDIVVDEKIERTKIAKKVFNNPELLKSLETLVHPAVKEATTRRYLKACEEGHASLFVVEIPLLFETEGEEWFDTTIAVLADPKVCVKRFQNGDTEYEKRMARQLDPLEKAKKADIVIQNNGSLSDLKQQVTSIYQNLIH
jgi:dephospho-CoA kinase